MSKDTLFGVLTAIALGYCGWLGVQVVSIKSEVSVVAHQTDQMWNEFIQRRVGLGLKPISNDTASIEASQ